MALRGIGRAGEIGLRQPAVLAPPFEPRTEVLGHYLPGH
jgi:hypothetical protein